MFLWPIRQASPSMERVIISLSHVTGGYFGPIHYSLLKVVPSSSVHFEAPRFGNARCLPHIESFFFRHTGLPTDGTLECNFWNTAIQPADEKGPKQQCVEFLRNIRSTRIHGTDGTFTNMTGCIFYGKINTSLMDPMGIKSVRSRIVFSFLFF